MAPAKWHPWHPWREHHCLHLPGWQRRAPRRGVGDLGVQRVSAVHEQGRAGGSLLAAVLRHPGSWRDAGCPGPGRGTDTSLRCPHEWKEGRRGGLTPFVFPPQKRQAKETPHVDVGAAQQPPVCGPRGRVSSVAPVFSVRPWGRTPLPSGLLGWGGGVVCLCLYSVSPFPPLFVCACARVCARLRGFVCAPVVLCACAAQSVCVPACAGVCCYPWM